jgi:hypothetical protein
MTEIWTTDEVAAHCGIAATSVRKTMSRWSVTPIDREPGRRGQSRYRAEDVRAAKEAAPGKGNRTPRATA